jgi:hypothetical protein
MDTFPGLTLVEGCHLLIEARIQGGGGIDGQAVISNAVAWVTAESGGAGGDISPLVVPTPLASFGSTSPVL